MTNPQTTLLQIQQVETLAANAWPAAEVQDLDGWRLRHTVGVTRRANSVWPNATEDGLAVLDKVDAVEVSIAHDNCRRAIRSARPPNPLI